jgi:hypothetical protein
MLTAALAAALAGPAPAQATTPTPDARIGALFFPSVLGLLPTLSGPHYCSASVVHSAAHDLIATAAHCVYGTGAGIEFVPGFDNGAMPHGSWDVRAAYVDAAWKKSNDPKHDIAFLRLYPHQVAGKTVNIEDVVGAFTLGTAPLPGQLVHVTGYPAGSGGGPVSCATTSYDTAGYPTIACPGFVNGTSGGPWVRGSTLVGDIGGLHEGGCTPQISYSAPFDPNTAALLARASAGGPADFTLPPLSDGC